MSSYDEDPLDYLNNETAALKQAVGGIYQAAATQHQQQQFISEYQQQAAEYAQGNAQFSDAYKELVDRRQSELQSVGYSKQEAANLLVQEEAMFVRKAMHDGVNPAERMFELAKARGFHASPNSAAELEAEAQAFNEMEAAEAASVDPDNITDSQLDSLWSEMEKAERGTRPW